MVIGIASDHHGVDKKSKLVEYLQKKGYKIVDYGPNTTKSVDYPDYAFKVGTAIRNKEIDSGILMCGTGIGMSIAANKVTGVRCARIVSINDAKYAKEHNHANIISFSANLSLFRMKRLINKYLNTFESDEERHVRRVNMIDNYHD